jgi:hypothetical protein
MSPTTIGTCDTHRGLHLEKDGCRRFRVRLPAPVSPPSGSAAEVSAGAFGNDREGAPAPCASASQPQGQGTRDAEGAPDRESAAPVTIWVAECPFRRNGSPVLGTMGSTTDTVIVFRSAEWKRLCAAIPALATTAFNVGTYE